MALQHTRQPPAPHAAFSPEPRPQPGTSTQVSQVTTNSSLGEFYIFCIFITFFSTTFIPAPDTQGKAPGPLLSGCQGSAVTLLQRFPDPQHLTTPPHPCPKTTPCFMWKSNTSTGHAHTMVKTSLRMTGRHGMALQTGRQCVRRESTGHTTACLK